MGSEDSGVLLGRFDVFFDSVIVVGSKITSKEKVSEAKATQAFDVSREEIFG